MMWLARQEEDDLKKPQAQMLLDYCHRRRDGLIISSHQQSMPDVLRAARTRGRGLCKLCGEILRNGVPAPIFPPVRI